VGAALGGAAALGGCTATQGPPEEFPPVTLGMEWEDVRRSVAKRGGRIDEESPHSFRVMGRDRRVAQEMYFFHHDQLAAFTLRYAEEATTGSFRRLARRYTLAYGEPVEEDYDEWLLRASWRMKDPPGRVLLSGFVGGREPDSPLMARVEDPSVMPRLLRVLEEEGQAEELEP
jgi:hypothetical protein